MSVSLPLSLARKIGYFCEVVQGLHPKKVIKTYNIKYFSELNNYHLDSSWSGLPPDIP